jgi:serine/threonine protein kinase
MHANDTILLPAKYQVVKMLGAGATATVYLAIHKTLKRQVALKVMVSHLASDPDFLQRFLGEGPKLAQLQHPNIVAVYDSGVFDNAYYLEMEYVSGGSLRERIGQLTAEQALDILSEVADALDYAHKRGFVHRDIKPGNILFRDDGHSVLSDFGIAKALKERTHYTSMGVLVGTLQYMSPEQAQGKEVDPRSDLYSLGVVFYEMLMGRPPYASGADPIAAMLMHVQDPIPQLPERYSQYQELLNKLLAKDPSDRFQRAADIIEFVKTLRSDATPTPEPPTDATPTPEPPIWRWAMMGLILLLLVGVGAYFLIPNSRSPESVDKRPPESVDKQPPCPEASEAAVREFLLMKISPQEAFRCGQKLMVIGSYDALNLAFMLFVEAAERGYAPAALAVGQMYDPNDSGPSPLSRRRADEAYEWYKKAAEGSLPAAQERLTALRLWLEQQAAQGDPAAFEVLKDWR